MISGSLGWPVSAIGTNIVTLVVLVGLLRRERRRWCDLFRIDRHRIGRDLFTAAWLSTLAAILIIVPNFGLATILFGDATAPLDTFYQPLPRWTAFTVLALFPLTITLSELPIYFGYLQPRLETLTGRGWLAVALTAGFLAVIHSPGYAGSRAGRVVVYRGTEREFSGEDELTVATQDPTQRPDNDPARLWRQVGEQLIHGQSRLDARLDRLEGDVSVLKTDLAATKEQLGRLERATASRFDRVDAKLERLITLVRRDETKRP